MQANGPGRGSDVFISVWLVSGELAVWAALVQCCIDHSSMQTMRREFLREMPSKEEVNWNRLQVCACVRERACTYACIIRYVKYPKITPTL